MKAWIALGIVVLAANGFCASAKETKTAADRGLDKSAPIAVYNKLMATYDTNRNGILDAAEKTKMTAEDKAKFEEILAKFDTNKDGKIAGDELAALKKAKKEAEADKAKPETEDPNREIKKGTSSALDKVL